MTELLLKEIRDEIRKLRDVKDDYVELPGVNLKDIRDEIRELRKAAEPIAAAAGTFLIITFVAVGLGGLLLLKLWGLL
jgi:hypothetical protein